MNRRLLSCPLLVIAGLITGCSGGGSGSTATPTSGPTISSFTSSAAQVNQGQSAVLTWTLSGTPTSLTLDGVALAVSQTSATVTPTRRQTYTLVAGGASGSDTKTTTVVARGLSLLAGDVNTAGTADGSGAVARFNRPIYVTADASGNAFLSDQSNHAIRKVTPAGVVSTVVGTPGTFGYQNGPVASAQLYLPRGHAFDGAGNLFIMDAFNNVLRKMSSGTVSTLSGTYLTEGSLDGAPSIALFKYPNGMTMDTAGNLIVADSNNYTIRKVTPAGVVTTLAGTAGVLGSADGTGPAASFGYVEGPGMDAAGNLFVSDATYHTIRKITPGGVVTTVAGSPGQAGSLDGLGSAARFNSPVQVAVDSAGNLFVADANNATIRKITTGGQVSTIVGQPGVQNAVLGPFPASLKNPLGVAVLPSGDLVILANHAVFLATAP